MTVPPLGRPVVAGRLLQDRFQPGPVDLDDDVLWFNDLGRQNVVAMRQFPNRRYYRLVSESTATWKTRMNVVEITEESLAREARSAKGQAGAKER